MIQIGRLDGRTPDHHGVGDKITEPLATPVCKTGQTADQIKCRQTVDKAEQISNHNLTELQVQAVHIGDPQTQQSFAKGLPVPIPLSNDSITDGNGEISEDTGCRCQIAAEDPGG